VLFARKDSVFQWLDGVGWLDSRVGTRKANAEREVEALWRAREVSSRGRFPGYIFGEKCHRATWMPENLGTVDPLGLTLQSRAVDVVDRWGSVTAGR
jgi:hypothetical protein